MVRGLDATAAQTFGTLRSLLQRLGIELLISELGSASAVALLTAHGVIGPDACRRVSDVVFVEPGTDFVSCCVSPCAASKTLWDLASICTVVDFFW